MKIKDIFFKKIVNHNGRALLADYEKKVLKNKRLLILFLCLMNFVKMSEKEEEEKLLLWHLFFKSSHYGVCEYNYNHPSP